jgi:hypothetical protein
MITTDHPTVIPPPPPTPPHAVSEPPFSLRKVLLGLILVVAAFDICFWDVKGMGFSIAVFVPVLAAAILANRDKPFFHRSTIWICLLLAGACWAAAIETGTTNTLSLMILVIALAGDSYFENAGEAWGRWISQLFALAFAPGRIFWLAARLLEALFGSASGSAVRLVGGILLAIPALVLALVFGALLASGNAVFGTWTGNFFDWLWKELTLFFDFGRIVMWLFVAFIALPLLRPARISPVWWNWIPQLPRLPALVPANGAIFSSALILVVLNLIFAIANVADAMFLWSKAKLPAGITYSSFVHNGVNTLTFTVVLSAIVLAGIFQQEPRVAGRYGLKALGLVWVAQNLFVLVSVVLRLKLYIEAYDMTVTRLSVIIFLLLVAAGYGLLTIKIAREKSLPWLVGSCAVAIFVTFYLTQFLNLSGWSASYNVAQWEKDKTRNLDMSYLCTLGPAAWPALRQAADEEGGTLTRTGAEIHTGGNLSVYDISFVEPTSHFDFDHWREFSLRAWWNSWALDDKK